MFLGLRTVVYHTDDLNGAKAWYSSVLGISPYFDQPFYVGFNVGGFELGTGRDRTGVGEHGGSTDGEQDTVTARVDRVPRSRVAPMKSAWERRIRSCGWMTS